MAGLWHLTRVICESDHKACKPWPSPHCEQGEEDAQSAARLNPVLRKVWHACCKAKAGDADAIELTTSAAVTAPIGCANHFSFRHGFIS